MTEYAVYKGENMLAVGTIQEIASELNIKEESVRFMRSPAYARRLAKRKDRGENCRVIVALN